jgi:uncharacterized protein YccT (UPF0319 family)
MPFLPSPKHPSKQKIAGIAVALSLGLAGLSTSTPLWADAEVAVPENVIVLAIDGQETGNSGFFSRKLTTYKLPAGEHTITGRYDVIRSNGVMIRATLSDQQVYTLSWLPEPKTQEDAEAFIKKPTLIITAEGGKVIASQQGVIAPSKSIISTVVNGLGQLTGNNTPPVTALQQMQSSWQQATPEQKKQFRQWMDQQANQ